jgi:hypothetical protein
MSTLPSAVVLNQFNASICQVCDEAMHKQLLYEIKHENWNLKMKHWKTSLRYARVGSRAYTHTQEVKKGVGSSTDCFLGWGDTIMRSL